MKNETKGFQWQPFSDKQIKLLSWWIDGVSPFSEFDGVIAEGSIRAGKTVAMIESFLNWSLHCFDGESFIIAGNTMGALKRNVLNPMFQILHSKGVDYKYVRTDDPRLEIGNNTYYLFGANNEKSQDPLQGLTAAGAYMDEVALMPQSFVDQAQGRCSVDGAKLWFNCNPKGPYHWFKEEYVDKAKEKRYVLLHFTMDDNLSLSQQVKDRFKRMFSGVFYKRNIDGLWVVAEGIIYEMFSEEEMTVTDMPGMEKKWIACDYGTSNATTFLLFGLGTDGRLYIMDEYYHSGRTEEKKSPSKYAVDFWKWTAKNNLAAAEVDYIFIDPSAEGFILELYNHAPSAWRKKIAQADNEVKAGIELVSSVIDNDYMRVHKNCVNTLKEFSSYAWDEVASERGEDKPLKTADHCMDPVRYVCNGTRPIWQNKGVT